MGDSDDMQTEAWANYDREFQQALKAFLESESEPEDEKEGQVNNVDKESTQQEDEALAGSEAVEGGEASSNTAAPYVILMDIYIDLPESSSIQNL